MFRLAGLIKYVPNKDKVNRSCDDFQKPIALLRPELWFQYIDSETADSEISALKIDYQPLLEQSQY